MSNKNTGIPKRSLPIIGGEKDKETKALINESIKTILAQLDPIFSNMGIAIEEVQKRLAILEETKPVLPSKIEVVVKHENTYAGQPLAGSVTFEEKK